MDYYEFDGSLEGILTAIFTVFDKKEKEVELIRAGIPSINLFDYRTVIESQQDQAHRVWSKLQQTIGVVRAHDFYRAILAEDPRADQAAFYLMREIFKGRKDALSNFGEPHALYFGQTLKKINRERHRMTAFVRFRKSHDGLFVSEIAPDFNVLPLIKDFFKKRFADQQWLIVDTHRNYGIWYNLQDVFPVTIASSSSSSLIPSVPLMDLDDREMNYQKLWQCYYQHTTIQERLNSDLFLRHVPRRYWSLMTEFNLS